MADPQKMSITEFAQKIKAGHPEYHQLDDQELANRVLAKFPQYRQHVNMVAQPEKQASFGDRLTAGGSSEGAQKFDQAHPILGKPLRALDAAGGAVLGLPGSIYHAFADPVTDGRSKWEAVPERLIGAEAAASALQDYGAGKVSPRAALSVLPEALGTGAGTVGGVEAAGLGLGKITRPGVAKLARFGARASDFDLTKPLSLAKPALTHLADRLENVAPAGRDATMNPKNIPEFAGEESPETGAPVYRDATLNKRNIPEYAGEGDTSGHPNAVAPRIGGRRMGPPLRPLVGSPEEWQAYDAQKAILKPEASDAGLYSAARGAVSRVPDYQIRIGKRLAGFGEPVNLMEESEPPARPKKAENE